MTNWAFLQVVANVATVANALASWRVVSALATPAYDALSLRTLVDRLRDEQYILVNVVWEDNYRRLNPASRDRAMIAIRRYVYPDSNSTLDGFSFSFYLGSMMTYATAIIDILIYTP